MLREMIDKWQRRLEMKTISSGLIWQRACQHMVDGTPSALQKAYPWPPVLKGGDGAYVTDEDGNEYADFHLGFSVMVAGHGQLKIDDYVHSGSLTREACLTSELVCERFNLDRVQWTNSGTEATLLAVRLARGYTGKNYMVKLEGGYHGMHDDVMISTHPAMKDVGDEMKPDAVTWGEGTLASHTRVVPYNNLDAMRVALETGDVAAVIIEPVMFNVGCIMPENGYLKAVRELTQQYGALLIFDEVKTGLTVAYAGAEEAFGVKPDLKCLGKGIGGGLPCGLVGGKQEIMEKIPDVPHYATFAGNPWVMQAGYHLLTKHLTPENFNQAASLNQKLLTELNDRLDKNGLPGYAVGIGTKGTIIWAKAPAKNYREWSEGLDDDLTYLYWLVMMHEGIFMSPGGDEQWTISTAHTQHEIDKFLAAFDIFTKEAQIAIRP